MQRHRARVDRLKAKARDVIQERARRYHVRHVADVYRERRGGGVVRDRIVAEVSRVGVDGKGARTAAAQVDATIERRAVCLPAAVRFAAVTSRHLELSGTTQPPGLALASDRAAAHDSTGGSRLDRQPAELFSPGCDAHTCMCTCMCI